MNLNFKEFGEGEPLVILHGLFGTLDNWQTVARQLSTQFTVFIVDLPNHGRSPHTKGEFDYSEMSDALAEFLLQHWIYETRLVGHSMGGKLAMQLALNQPDLVKKLVIIDIAPKKYQGGHENIFKALLALNLQTLNNRTEAAQYLTDNLPEESSGTIQFLLKNLSRQTDSEGGGFEWKMNLKSLWDNYPRILDNIEAHKPFQKPTLFIRGSASNYIQNTDFPHINQLFPHATIETVDEAGHWIHADKPVELLHLLTNFL